jgi:hypothetical protein
MDWTFTGLPLHVLLVHLVVVVVPLAALCLLLGAAWPTARRRLGIVTPLVALVALVAVPITTEAGEALEEQVPETALSELHGHLGEDLLPWVVALFAVALLDWAWRTLFSGTGPLARHATARRLRIAVQLALALAVATVVVGAVVETVIVGESGARAAWEARLR